MDRQDKDSGLRAALAQLLPELRALRPVARGSRAEADDLVQEAVLRMLRGLDDFVMTPEHAGDVAAALRPWGLTVCATPSTSSWRARKREQAHLAEHPPEEEARSGGQESRRTDARPGAGAARRCRRCCAKR